MTTKVKKIKAKLGFHGTTDADVLKQLNTVHDGMNGNSAFPTPPVDMTIFKKGIDLFTVPKKVTISSLTPAAIYAFQVRALGRLGHTDCSDSMTFICGEFPAGE